MKWPEKLDPFLKNAIKGSTTQNKSSKGIYQKNFPFHLQDGKLSAQFEQTMLVTETGVDVLTARPGKPFTPYFMDSWMTRGILCAQSAPRDNVRSLCSKMSRSRFRSLTRSRFRSIKCSRFWSLARALVKFTRLPCRPENPPRHSAHLRPARGIKIVLNMTDGGLLSHRVPSPSSQRQVYVLLFS